MNTKLPTAEEFLMQRGCGYYRTPGATIFEVNMFDMIEFAKLHVKEALKAASEDASMDIDFICSQQEGSIGGIDKESILNAYPNELIK